MRISQHLPLHATVWVSNQTPPKASRSAKTITTCLPHGSTCQLPVSGQHCDIFPIQKYHLSVVLWNKYDFNNHEGFLGCVPWHTTRGTTPRQVHTSPTASTTPHSGRFLWKFSPFALFCVWFCLWANGIRYFIGWFAINISPCHIGTDTFNSVRQNVTW